MLGRISAVAVALVALLTAACGSGAGSASAAVSAPGASSAIPPTPSGSGPVYSRPGPYPAGVTTLHLDDGAQMEVWHPAVKSSQAKRRPDSYNIADYLPAAVKSKIPPGGSPAFVTDGYRGLPAAKGSFPLVVFCHGYGSFPDQSTFLTTHLAQWGFVVAAPEFLSRDLASVFGQKPTHPQTDDQVIRQTVEVMKAQGSSRTGLLAGRVDSSRLSIIGHSAGGFDSIQFAGQPDVRDYVSLSAGADTGPLAAEAPSLAHKPSLYMVGAVDHVVAASEVETTYQRAPAPKRLVVLGGAGHLAFTDICLIGKGQGGVLAIAKSLGISVPPQLATLASDGCGPQNLPPKKGFPVIDDFVTGQLRHAVGIDKADAGLRARVADDFPGVQVAYQHQP